jgi:hypothetical protein
VSLPLSLLGKGFAARAVLLRCWRLFHERREQLGNGLETSTLPMVWRHPCDTACDS